MQFVPSPKNCTMRGPGVSVPNKGDLGDSCLLVQADLTQFFSSYLIEQFSFSLDDLSSYT